MMTFETMHSIKKILKVKKAKTTIKLDMMKAYDGVEWNFQRFILNKFGFSKQWVHLIRNNVENVSYSLFVNSENLNPFRPTRLLRQRDLLSLYLFTLCVKSLSSLFRKAYISNHLKSVTITRVSLRVSHLFFSDDSFVFIKANWNSC